jgi:hypothetical protein
MPVTTISGSITFDVYHYATVDGFGHAVVAIKHSDRRR